MNGSKVIPIAAVKEPEELSDDEIELIVKHQADMVRMKLTQDRDMIRLRKKLATKPEPPA